MEELLNVLKRALPKVDWETDMALVDDGVIDSVDVVSVISEITDEYDIEIRPRRWSRRISIPWRRSTR